VVKRLSLVLLTLLSILALSACSNFRGAVKSSTSLASLMGVAETPDWYIRSKHRYPDSRWIPNDFGLQMHYRDVGSKDNPVVLLLHSELSSLHSYQDWIDLLSQDFRVIALDLPGAGLTGAPHCVSDIEKTCAENLSLDYINHTLHYFIEDMRLDSFTLVASSLSAYLAARYTLDNPHRVDNLVLISPLGMPQDIPWILNYMTASGMDVFNRYVQPSTTITTILDDFYGDRANLKQDVLARYLHLNQSEGAFESNVRILKLVRDLMESTLDLNIHDIGARTLIMWGKQDSWGNPEHARLWSEEIKDSVLIEYAFLGHLPMEESGKTTGPDLLAFLQKKPIPSLTGIGTGGTFTIQEAKDAMSRESLFDSQSLPSVNGSGLPTPAPQQAPEPEMEVVE
jgi:pimeloyl-ACP methyl ester carboxylesterase